MGRDARDARDAKDACLRRVAFVQKSSAQNFVTIQPILKILICWWVKPSPAGKGDHEVVDEEVALGRINRL